MIGAPVELHPDADCPKDARMNEFNYDVNSHTNCPFASHMRKTKPRSIVSDRDMNDIMRRGIPYGPEVGANETKTEQDRGLMFTCYQSSISNGFQFLKRSKSLHIDDLDQSTDSSSKAGSIWIHSQPTRTSILVVPTQDKM
jgi:deferrochelatase/peroxidase EfeB